MFQVLFQELWNRNGSGVKQAPDASFLGGFQNKVDATLLISVEPEADQLLGRDFCRMTGNLDKRVKSSMYNINNVAVLYTHLPP